MVSLRRRGARHNRRARIDRAQLGVVELARGAELAVVRLQVKGTQRLAFTVRQLLLGEGHSVLLGVVKATVGRVPAGASLHVKLARLLPRALR